MSTNKSLQTKSFNQIQRQARRTSKLNEGARDSVENEFIECNSKGIKLVNDTTSYALNAAKRRVEGVDCRMLCTSEKVEKESMLKHTK